VRTPDPIDHRPAEAGALAPGQDPALEGPAVTVIIVCRNEVAFIDRCLASVFAFEPVPGGFEVIVVDGRSSDGTREKLTLWENEKQAMRVLENPGLVAPIGLNLGIRAARGRFLMRLDAHSEYPPDYLRLGLETIERTAADNVGGVLRTMPSGSALSARLVAYLSTHRFGVGNSRFRIGAEEGPADTVPFGCFRLEVFSRTGLFDERLVRNQDYEFNRRLVRSGGTVWLNPSMVATYYNRSSLNSLLKQAWQTGKWNAWMWYVAPYSFATRHAVPALFVAGQLLLGVGAVLFPMAGIGLIAVNLCYLALACAVAFRHARDEALWVRALLAACFLLYHVSYGLGTLVGVGALLTKSSPVQRAREPWPGAGRFRAWPTERPE
jgi:GT2 family glycosyltransferase